jgi:hypothetical protein
MGYLRPIPRRLLPDSALVFPSDGASGFGQAVLMRHVRLELTDTVTDDPHRASAPKGTLFIDSTNTTNALEVPAGSKILVNDLPRMMVRSCKRCCVIRGQVHHWELEVG